MGRAGSSPAPGTREAQCLLGFPRFYACFVPLAVSQSCEHQLALRLAAFGALAYLQQYQLDALCILQRERWAAQVVLDLPRYGLATGIQRHNSRPVGDAPSPASTPAWQGQLVNTQLQLGLTRFLWGRRF